MAHPDYSRLRHFNPLDTSVSAKFADHCGIRHSWIITAIEYASHMRLASFVVQSLPERILGTVQCDVDNVHTSSTWHPMRHRNPRRSSLSTGKSRLLHSIASRLRHPRSQHVRCTELTAATSLFVSIRGFRTEWVACKADARTLDILKRNLYPQSFADSFCDIAFQYRLGFTPLSCRLNSWARIPST